jgi:hypothetical protein
MDCLTVYGFNYFDRVSGLWTRAPDFATAKAIGEMSGTLLLETAREVRRSDVSRSGIVRDEDSRRPGTTAFPGN